MSKVKAFFAGIFTLHRWALNPFQMYSLSFLFVVAVNQIQMGVTPTSVLADLPRNALLSLAISNAIGAVIALYGLHLRDLEAALWVEFWGYVILIFVLATFVLMLAQSTINASASYGFGLSEAFIFAAVHRSIQILLYKRARFRSGKLSVAYVTQAEALSDITPEVPVRGEGLDP